MKVTSNTSSDVQQLPMVMAAVKAHTLEHARKVPAKPRDVNRYRG